LFDLSLRNTEIAFPEPRRTLDEVQEQFVRDRQIDKQRYYPRDVDRDLVRRFPEGFKIDLRKLVAEQVRDKVASRCWAEANAG
jgi:ribonuclease Z